MALPLTASAIWDEIDQSERACFQITEGSYSGLEEVLIAFLSKWRYVDRESYILVSAEGTGTYLRGCDGHFVLEIEKYLDLVEVYAVKLLGVILKDTDRAIDWVEEAELPEEKRLELLRRLQSLKATSSSQSVETSLLTDKNEAHVTSGMELTSFGAERASRTLKVKDAAADDGDDRKQALLKLTGWVEPCFSWFRTVKVGSARLVISYAKTVLWGSFIIFIFYSLQRKRATLKRIASKQAGSVKKAVVDMWQLAFSVQVNPLAVVQQIPAGARPNR